MTGNLFVLKSFGVFLLNLHKSMNEKKKKSIATKLKITLSAMSLFQKYGFAAVSVRDICGAASISIGSFYYYFKSKEEIINTIHQQLDLLWEEKILHHHYGEDLKANVLYLFEEAGGILEDLGWEVVTQSYLYLLASSQKYAIQTDRPIYVQLRKVMNAGRSDLRTGTDIDALIDRLIRSGRGVLFEWCLLSGRYNLNEKLREDLSLILDSFCGETS